MNFLDLRVDFLDQALVIAAKHQRLKAIGYFRDGMIAVIFVRLGSEGVSVISMRPASKKERALYEEFR